MKTEVEEAPKSPKKAEQPQQKGKFTREALMEAIKKDFKGVEGRIDPRYLWTDGGVHRFRVNCWKAVAVMNSEIVIHHSEFVHVTEDKGKLSIRRRTHDK